MGFNVSDSLIQQELLLTINTLFLIVYHSLFSLFYRQIWDLLKLNQLNSKKMAEARRIFLPLVMHSSMFWIKLISNEWVAIWYQVHVCSPNPVICDLGQDVHCLCIISYNTSFTCKIINEKTPKSVVFHFIVHCEVWSHCCSQGP